MLLARDRAARAAQSSLMTLIESPQVCSWKFPTCRPWLL
jgi:hypothetical protein